MKNNSWFSSLLLIVLGWTLIGSLVLGSQSYNISSWNGKVFTQINAGDQLLPRMEKIVQAEMSDRSDIISKITESQKVLTEAQANRDADTYVNEVRIIDSYIRSYDFPSGIEKLQEDLAVATEGVIHRVSYAQSKLIDAETSYNQTRLYFPVNAIFTREKEILGSNSNPTKQLTPTNF